ncbi:hypothetical protein [Flavihumibacter petaseus]|uniref:Uncharacterized protein n=1 Tax=Flavihumibacter petaseus NBRC 106054 TaxID=1220578 RepID=A0A0E9MW56_9BACT|nr:hypothetical protein [Flavihumibacter petaseus]GAO41824.1 hypothetical protein FPE01S_01_08390 [Flavihumibacter petaseus NBRC 106054]
MKRFQQKVVVLLAVVISSVIGAIKGQEAKQKWMFRILSKQDERQSRAVRKSDAREGKVLLDDIEMAAYHNS